MIYYQDQNLMVRGMAPSHPKIIALEEPAQGWHRKSMNRF